MRKTVLLVLMAAAGLMAFFAAQSTDGNAGAGELMPGPVPDAETQESQPERLPQPIAQPTAHVREASQEQSAANGPSERTEIEAPIPEGTLAVLVKGPSGILAGFEVLAITDAYYQEAQDFLDPAVADEMMASRGRPFVTSDVGIVNIPVAEGWSSLVLGRTDGLWGSLAIPRGATEQQLLELSPDRNLRALVLGVDGAPIGGIEVHVKRKVGNGATQLRSARTAMEDGVAVFIHAQSLFEGVSDDTTLALALQALTREPITEVIDPTLPSTHTYTLQLPPTGRVIVHVWNEQQEPAHGSKYRVRLNFMDPGERKVESAFHQRRRSGVSQLVSDGKALFDHVQLGLELDAAARRTDWQVETHAYGTGPLRAGGSVELSVRLGSDHPFVQLDVVDEEHTPLRNVSVVVLLEEPNSALPGKRSETRQTDSEGLLLFDLDRGYLGSNLSLTLILQGGEDKTGRVEEFQLDRVGRTDLGVVVMKAAEVLIAGQCVTASGDPIGGVQLALQLERGERGDWSDDYNFTQLAEGDGSFQILDLPAGKQFRLAGQKEGYSSSWQEVKRGQQDVVLVFEQEGQLVGSVLADEGVPVEKLLIGVAPHSTGTEYLHYNERTCAVNADGSFRLGKLASGSRDVVVSMARASGVLFVLSDIQIVAGQESDDARLQPLDLRGKLWVHELTLVAPTSDGAVRGSLRFAESGAEKLENYAWGLSSDIVFLSNSARVDFELTCDGFRPVRRQGFGGKETVELQRGLPVKLGLRGDTLLPKPPLFLAATLRAAGSSGGSFGAETQSFGESREIRVLALEPGRMQVTWLISKSMGQGAIGMTIDSDPPQFVEVEDLEVEQTFQIELSLEELKAMTEKIDGN